MEPAGYVAVARRGSTGERLLEQLTREDGRGRAGIRLASADGSGVSGLGNLAALLPLLSTQVTLLRGSVVLSCGTKWTPERCNDVMSCIMDALGFGSPSPPFPSCPAPGGAGGKGHGQATSGLNSAGPTAGDPVNLNTLEEEYEPEPDLTVYNPAGPSIEWRRVYDSLRGLDGGVYGVTSANYYNVGSLNQDDFGVGWSHSYNIALSDRDSYSAPAVPVGGSAPMPCPGQGGETLRWYIEWSGTPVASYTSANGWSATFFVDSDPAHPRGSVQVQAPVTAAAGTGYLIQFIDLRGYVAYSASFEVVAARAARAGSGTELVPDGASAPGAGAVWEVRKAGAVLAASAFADEDGVAQPARGWVALLTTAASPRVQLFIPLHAVPDTDYEVRFRRSDGTTLSASFRVLPHQIQMTLLTDQRRILFPNGSSVRLNPESVPTAAQPVAICNISYAGGRTTAEWEYDPASDFGRFTIRFGDGTEWVFQGCYVVPASIFSTRLFYTLVAIRDSSGNALTLNYQSPALVDSGRPLLTSIDNAATGRRLLTITRATDGTGNITRISDAYGRSVHYRVDRWPFTNPHDPAVTAYQDLSAVSQVVPAGVSNPPVRWAYAYANVPNGHFTEEVPFLDRITVPSPTGAGTSQSQIVYDRATGWVSRMIDANGNERRYIAIDGQTTRVEVRDGAGILQHQYTHYMDTGFHPKAAWTGAEQVTQKLLWSTVQTRGHHNAGPDRLVLGNGTDGNGPAWSYGYDPQGRLTSELSARSGGVGSYPSTAFTWDDSTDRRGRLVRVRQARSGTVFRDTAYTYYEPSGRLQSVTRPAPAGSGQTTVTSTFTYDSLGNPLTITGPGNGAAATRTVTLNYTQDDAYTQAAALGQPLTVRDHLGHTTHLRYDARGNVIAFWDALGNRTDVLYNLADQPVQVLSPPRGQTGTGRARTVSAYLYPGGPQRAVTLFDESGRQVRQVRYRYGLEGELLERTGSAEPVRLTYDANYRVKTLSDGNGQTTTYAYDPDGNLSQVTYPGGDLVRFPANDVTGRTLQRVDGRGVVTNYVYNDPERLLTGIQYPATPALNVSLSYDGYGRLAQMTDGSGTQAFAYDDQDNPTSVTTTYTGLPAKTVSYAYNPDGSRKTMTTPAGTFAYQYEGAGRPTRLTSPFGETSSWSYLDNGWLASQRLPNGVTTRYRYDPVGELTDLLTQTASGVQLSRFTSAYDAASNRTSLASTVRNAAAATGLTLYTYDGKDQLLREQSGRAGGYTDPFAYDSAGNPTSFKGTPNAFNVNNQNTANTYDGNGNPTTYRGTTLTYDPENRLSAYGSVLTAGYRGDGLRAWKQTAAGRTYFLYDGLTPVCELNASGGVTAVNTFGANGLLSRRAGTTSTFYTFDLQGSVCQRLNAAGSVIASETYDAFGVRRNTAPPTADPFGYDAQWGYYTDRATGLQLCTWRYYDPAGGRWLTRDPIGYAGGINVYAHVSNSPTGLVDPSGLECDPYEQARETLRFFYPGITPPTEITPGLLGLAETLRNEAEGAGFALDFVPRPNRKGEYPLLKWKGIGPVGTGPKLKPSGILGDILLRVAARAQGKAGTYEIVRAVVAWKYRTEYDIIRNTQ